MRINQQNSVGQKLEHGRLTKETRKQRRLFCKKASRDINYTSDLDEDTKRRIKAFKIRTPEIGDNGLLKYMPNKMDNDLAVKLTIPFTGVVLEDFNELDKEELNGESDSWF